MPSHDDDIVAARRRRLREWIDAHYGGVDANFQKATKINQGELSGLLKGGKSFREVKAANLERQAGMPPGYLVNPLADSSALPASSQPERLDDDIINRAFELLYLLADARPEDRRFARLSWPMVKVAAKWIARAESQRAAVKGMLEELEEISR